MQIHPSRKRGKDESSSSTRAVLSNEASAVSREILRVNLAIKSEATNCLKRPPSSCFRGRTACRKIESSTSFFASCLFPSFYVFSKERSSLFLLRGEVFSSLLHRSLPC